MTKNKLTAQSLMKMSETQRDALVARYEKGVDESEFRPMTASQRKRWEKSVRATKALRRKQGRPVVGAGAKVVAGSIERELLNEADRYAKAHKLKRAQMIAQGLRLLMRKAG